MATSATESPPPPPLFRSQSKLASSGYSLRLQPGTADMGVYIPNMAEGNNFLNTNGVVVESRFYVKLAH